MTQIHYTGGVDVGSTQTKAVIIDEAGRIAARCLVDTGANVTAAAQKAFDAACSAGGIDPAAVRYVVGTGYGRYKVTFGDKQVTEISCHGRGAVHMFPGTRTVIDMGGQDSKAIRVGADGEIVDFCMNDKCAAGTGRFLGAAAKALGLSLDELGPTALRASKPVRISTTCTVFAESEVLAWLGKGRSVEDILWGVHKSIATRSFGLLRRVGISEQISFTGGVARNPGMVRALEEALGKTLNVSDDSHYMGALGAALFARDAWHAGAAAAPTEPAGAVAQGA
ncbi:MAG TPA: acyl-CoA dehydratase activase [Rubrivivax sp.]|nr:acyl-CoA dehydratase activase [Rubrivivax sp.]